MSARVWSRRQHKPPPGRVVWEGPLIAVWLRISRAEDARNRRLARLRRRIARP